MTIKEKALMVRSSQEILPLECLNDPSKLEAEGFFVARQGEGYLTFLYIGAGTGVISIEPLGFETNLPMGEPSEVCFKRTDAGWLRVQKNEIP